MFVLTATALSVAAACRGSAPIHVRFSHPPASVARFDFAEVVVSVARPRPGNPFTDAALRGWFETADGRQRWKVDGFCDSPNGATFRIRFMPQTAGHFRYFVEYSEDGAKQSATGEFDALDRGRRGAVQVDSLHPFHFVWSGTGEHYFLNGTTAYWLVGWRDDSVIASSIARLASLGVNRVRVTLAGRTQLAYGEPVIANEKWTSLINAWPAARPEDVYRPGFDFTRFNVEYWQKFERALRVARAHDVVVSVVLDMNDNPVHPPAWSDDERRFIRYAVARFGAFSNITWDLGDDISSYRTDDWASSTGTFLRNVDLRRHLVTMHPNMGGNSHQARSADWFGFTSLQEWSRQQHAFMLEARRLQLRSGRIIPQVNEEYGYEDHYPVWSPRPDSESADVLRRSAWDIAMAGGYQTTGETAKRGTNVWPDAGGGWMNGRGDSTMSMLRGYAHMVDFFKSFDWWLTQPNDSLVDERAYCLVDAGELYVVYLPNGGRTRISLASGRYDATWYDPSSGTWTPIGVAEGERWTTPLAPTSRDWALLLRRRRP